jgi:hypothetical protein
MILYYPVSHTSKLIAEALADVTGLPLRQLTSKLERKNKFLFTLHALYLVASGKGYPVDNMPERINADEIYVCAPIWGGTITGPAWYFLNHADLDGKKVNLVLTSASNNDNYRKKALNSLALIKCVPGKAYGFGVTKDTDKALLAEQLKQMLPDDALKENKPANA